MLQIIRCIHLIDTQQKFVNKTKISTNFYKQSRDTFFQIQRISDFCTRNSLSVFYCVQSIKLRQFSPFSSPTRHPPKFRRIEVMFFLIRSRIGILYQCDIVTLQHDSSEWFPILRFLMVFLGIVQHQIHVFIETNNVAFDPQVYILEQPNLHTRTILQITKYQVDGLHHHLLNFLWPLVRHFRIGAQKLHRKRRILKNVPRKRRGRYQI